MTDEQLNALEEPERPDPLDSIANHERVIHHLHPDATPHALAPSITLRPYQLQGSLFLQHGSRGLFDGVGLGKTLQVLHASQALRALRILVLLPKSLLTQWEEEIHKFYPTASTMIVKGTKAQRLNIYEQYYKRDYLLMGYETMREDNDALRRLPAWDIIICDEAVRISTSTTQLYKALIKLPAYYRWAITGTPVNNKITDIYGIFNWLQPNILGKKWQFEDRYTRKNYWGAVIGTQNTAELEKTLKPFYIRRTAEQVLPDLPDTIITDVMVDLYPQERELYKQIQKEIYHELTGGVADKIPLASLGNALVSMLRLEQAVAHPNLIGSEHRRFGKLDRLEELIDNILTNTTDKVIIFIKFKELANIIAKRLERYEPEIIHGDYSTAARGWAIDHFKEDPLCRILIGTSAIGEGLNLTAANHVIFYNHDWSIGKFIQKVGRAMRMTQTKTVFVWRMIGDKTIDQHIIKRLGAKQDLAQSLIKETIADDAGATPTVEEIEQILIQ